MVNSSARAGIPGSARSSTRSSPIRVAGSDGWCLVRFTFRDFGRTCSRLPSHRAGLSPRRYPAVVAQARVASIRCRSRVAVSVLVRQIGSRTERTWGSSIAATGSLPIFGLAWVSSERIHSARCFALRSSCEWTRWYAAAASSNVSRLPWDAARASLVARRCSAGCIPWRICSRASRAFWRACSSVTSGKGPRPISTRLTAIIARRIHERTGSPGGTAREGLTWNCRPDTPPTA